MRVQGMGGIGKTVLAAAIAWDPEVRVAFPDGVYWLSVGREANLLGLLRELADALGAHSSDLSSIAQARERVRRFLASRRALLVLDDVWTLEAAQILDVVTPPGRLLLSTRNGGILASIAAWELQVDVLEPDEALRLLASWAGQNRADMPSSAHQVAKECGFLPLALAMAGGLARRLGEWDEVLHRLRQADLERLENHFPDYPYPNLLRALAASIEALSPEERERYVELAVFPENAAIPRAAVETLWSAAGLDQSEANRLLNALADRSLLLRETGDRLALHDLQRDYIRKTAGSMVSLQRRFIESYTTCSPGGFATGPNDGWYFEQLPWHLAQAGMADELRELLFDVSWLQAKLAVTGVPALLTDYDLLSGDPAAPLFQAALRLSAHVVARDPDQLASQLLGRLSGEDAPGLDSILTQISQWSGTCWLRPLRPTLTQPGPLLRTFRTRSQLNTFVVVGGCQIVAATNSGLEAWDLETGEFLRSREGPVDDLIPWDNHRVATIRSNGEAGLWDLQTDAWTEIPIPRLSPLKAFLALLQGRTKRHRRGLRIVAAAGGRLAVAARGAAILIIDPDHGEILHVLRRKHPAHLSDLAALEPHVAASFTDGIVIIWDLATGRKVQELKLGPAIDGPWWTVMSARDGRLAAASIPCELKVWDWRSGIVLFHSSVADLRAYGLAWLDDERLASITPGGSLRLRTIPQGDLVRLPAAHSATPVGLASAVGGLVVSGSTDSLLRVWDMAQPAWVRTPAKRDGRISSIAFIDNDHAVCSWAQGMVWLLETRTGRLRSLSLVRRRRETLLAVLDIDRFVLNAGLGAVQVCAKDGRHRYSVQPGVDIRDAILVKPDRLVLRSVDSAWIFNPDNGWLRKIPMPVGEVLEQAGEGRWLVTEQDRKILRWDLGRRTLHQFSLDQHISGLASLGNDRLAVCLASRDLAVLNLETGSLLCHWTGEPRPNEALQSLISVSADRFASLSTAHDLRLWSGLNGALLTTFTFDVPPTAVAASPAGRTVVVGDRNGALHVLDLEESGTVSV